MKGKIERKRLLVVVGVAVVVLVAGATWAWAQTGGVINACVNPSDGTLYIVADPAECKKNETPLTWNILGPQGDPGLACWDLNGNGVGDPEEDINGDTVWDVLDCAGPQGEPGPQGEVGPTGPEGPQGAQGDPGLAGLACWDLNGNGVGDPEEDANGDTVVDVLDCQGAPGSADAWSLAGSAGTTPGTNYLGTSDDQALEIKVNGARALRLEPDATSPNLLGGYSGNWLAAGVYGATVGGGGDATYANRVTDSYGTVGGGRGNQAGDNAGTTDDRMYATVGGGLWNTASGYTAAIAGGYANTASNGTAFVGGGHDNIASGSGATIGGGWYNDATGDHSTIGGGWANDATGDDSTVSGGYENRALAIWSTVGGGMLNRASGFGATVPGGYYNAANGSYSFAAGRRAKANNQGCFVWGDSTRADVSCDTDNAWVARAAGGVTFYTSADLSTGVQVAAGSGAWSTVSDRNLKENVADVDAEQLLARLAGVPVSTWNYTSQDASIRHMGPMAQDFYGAFGLGEDDTHISTVDADGVALAAIQGLYAENQALKAENARQQAQIDDLEARLSALEQAAQPARSRLPLPWLFLAGGLVLAGGTWGVTRRR